MTEYNVYAIDSKANKHYLFTTLADSHNDAVDSLDKAFLGEAFGQTCVGFHLIETESDNRSRDELILDYIIEADDDTGTTGS